MSRVGSERPTAGAVPDPPLAPGAAATFGKYKLFASLGRGGMADVFLAVSRGPLGFNKLVVVKRLRATLADDPSFLNMFLDEARLAARLNHPNVVHTYEVGEEGGSFFIAMEYLEGQSLNRVIKDLAKRGEQLDEAVCARIISDALAGLHHAHTLRDYDGRPLEIVHRDVSPHNVFVTYDGQVKLVDFGIAKAASSSTVTEVGVLKGKVAYMAPEQAMGAPIDCRADVFGMGVVLWELLARRRLLAGDTAAATLHKLLNEPIPSISSARDVDAGLAAIVGRALEKDPDRRYQSAQEMREAIEEWIRVTGRKVRQEEIGAQITTLFHDVRVEVKRQIQDQMALVASAASSGDMAAAAIDSGRTPTGGAKPPRPRLPEIGVRTGSGSGVVAYGEPLAPPVSDEPPEPQPRRRGAIIVFVLLLLFAFVLAAFLLLKVAFAPKEDVVADRTPASASVPIATATASATTSATASATATATATVSATVSATAITPLPVVPTRVPLQPPTRNLVPPPAPSPSADKSPGFLTFDTYPWTRVTEGGRLLGTTPLIKISMSPGPHTLVLENPDQGIKKTYSVTIKSGETFAMRLGL